MQLRLDIPQYLEFLAVLPRCSGGWSCSRDAERQAAAAKADEPLAREIILAEKW